LLLLLDELRFQHRHLANLLEVLRRDWRHLAEESDRLTLGYAARNIGP